MWDTLHGLLSAGAWLLRLLSLCSSDGTSHRAYVPADALFIVARPVVAEAELHARRQPEHDLANSTHAHMAFGQIVVGPPGSGKSTCCKGLQHYFSLIGRPVAVINLDPANDRLPYEAAVDIGDLVSLEEVTASYGLGPNGGKSLRAAGKLAEEHPGIE